LLIVESTAKSRFRRWLLIAQAVQRERVHGESPFYTRRLYTRVSELLERHAERRSRPDRHFSVNAPAMTSPCFCAPLGRPPRGAADTRRRRTQEAVKRKIAKDTPSRMIIDYEE
jgi:hypothetical protein